MDLLSVFKRKTQATVAASDAADMVRRARTRARQRLIGAAVLIVAGIIGFPLLFENQPRPVPVDLPIEIPRKESVPPLAMPAAAPVVQAPPPSVPARQAASAARVITETRADAGREVATPAQASASASASEPSKARPGVPPRGAPAASEAGRGDGARAKALLEGRPTTPTASAPAASAARFVVQVGAFTDPTAVKEARAKVEGLGMKTYTQVAETPAGSRTRVRVGPFATRDEAERAAAKIRASALPTVVLAL